MVQLLDRYRRVADGKEFAVLATGGFVNGSWDQITLEAADGERQQSTGSELRSRGRYERIDD